MVSNRFISMVLCRTIYRTVLIMILILNHFVIMVLCHTVYSNVRIMVLNRFIITVLCHTFYTISNLLWDIKRTYSNKDNILINKSLYHSVVSYTLTQLIRLSINIINHDIYYHTILNICKLPLSTKYNYIMNIQSAFEV